VKVADKYLQEMILYIDSVLEGRFRVDGVQEWRKKHEGKAPESYLEDYSKARWWIFCSQN